MGDNDDEMPAPGQTVRAFEADTSSLEWTKTPTHIPAKRAVKVYSIELSDPTLRILARPTPFKSTLN